MEVQDEIYKKLKDWCSYDLVNNPALTPPAAKQLGLRMRSMNEVRMILLSKKYFAKLIWSSVKKTEFMGIPVYEVPALETDIVIV